MARVADSRVRFGSLKLEDCANPGTFLTFDCVPTAVAIVPGNEENAGEDSIEVLCGSTTGGSSGSENNTATLNITLISDFLEQGLVAYSWKCAGERKFEWVPNSRTIKVPGQPDANAPAQVWEGTVQVQPIEVGGEVNQRLTPSVSWNITSLMLPALYGGGQWLGPQVAGVTPPTSPALEWLFTPGNAMPFADLATLKADGAVGDAGGSRPNRDFTTGEYATIKGGTKVHYTMAGGWAANAAS